MVCICAVVLEGVRGTINIWKVSCIIGLLQQLNNSSMGTYVLIDNIVKCMAMEVCGNGRTAQKYRLTNFEGSAFNDPIITCTLIQRERYPIFGSISISDSEFQSVSFKKNIPFRQFLLKRVYRMNPK